MAKSRTSLGSIGMVAGGTLVLGDGSTALASVYTVQITGTWTGTITFKGTVDGTTYVDVLATPANSTTAATTATANNIYRVDASGLSALEVVGTASGTGTAVIYAAPTIG